MTDLFAGRFEILDPIAEGGMGSVWTARDHKHGTLVAVKLLRQADAGSLMRFMREQGTRIEHAHVITPISWAGEDDRVLFSMPLVTGGSVATLLGDYGQLTPVFTAEVLRQLLDALQAVHEAGVVHRDVKPGNLLLDPTGTDRPNVWLTDFGVATPVDAPRLTHVNHVIGTPGYLAPELLQFADPAPAQDLYAVGMLGGQMLTGQRPAMGETFAVYQRPEGCPDALWSTLAALAAQDVPARPATAALARDMLSVPELAWPAGGQEEIEVFEQVQVGTGLNGRTEDLRPVDTRVVTPPPPTLMQPPAPAPRASDDTTRPNPRLPMSAGVPPQVGAPVPVGSTAPAGRKPRSAAAVVGLLTFLGIALIGLAVVLAWHPWKSVGESDPSEPMKTSGHSADAPKVKDECPWNLVGTRTASQEDFVVTCTATPNDGYRWMAVPAK